MTDTELVQMLFLVILPLFLFCITLGQIVGQIMDNIEARKINRIINQLGEQ